MKLKSYRRKTLAAIQRAVMFGLPVASLLTIASCGPATHDDQKTALEEKQPDKENNSIRMERRAGEEMEWPMGKIRCDAKEGPVK